MNSIITQGIEITVETRYFADQSSPKEGVYFFVYFITIINKSDYTVQLQKRHWDIVDSNGSSRTIDGDGVVGEHPILEPGETYTYNSGCDFETDIGKMSGYYTMERLMDKTSFEVRIPEFTMIVPARLN